MVILSTVVASIGLIKDNLAVIIGAMVIAPLLGPNIGLALATTLGDSDLGKKALKTNFTGIFIAFILALGIGHFIPFVELNKELSFLKSSFDMTGGTWLI